MRRITKVALVVALSAVSLVPPAGAQGRRGRGQPQSPPPTEAKAAVSVTFTPAERDIIVKYYAAHPYRARSLPPGIAKNLARGKPLPPGIAKRALPAPLVAQLPRRTGVEVTIYGDRIVLLQASGVVVDVLEHVFR
jgi:hypothetical protein